MKEKRKFPRTQMPFCIAYNVNSKKRQYLGIVRDISSGGIRIACDPEDARNIAVNKILSVSVLLHNGAASASGRVTWAKKKKAGKEIGISFADNKDIVTNEIFSSIL